MRLTVKSAFAALFGLVLILSAASVTAADPVMIDGIKVHATYKPGFGAAVGRVMLVQGTVIVTHTGIPDGYRVTKELPLYKGDTLITRPRSRVRFKLNDGSIMTCASRTQLKINQSIYNKSKKTRSSFLSMNIGKARFWVTKMAKMRQANFRVRTPTAVCGVRGSDWVMDVTPTTTQVTTLEDTQLEVLSLATPDADPTLLNDLERTVVEEGEPPSDVESVAPDEVDQLKNEMPVTGTQAGTDPDVNVGQATGSGNASGSGSQSDSGGSGQPTGQSGQQGDDQQGDDQQGDDQQGDDQQGDGQQGNGQQGDDQQGDDQQGDGQQGDDAAGTPQSDTPVEQATGEDGIQPDATPDDQAPGPDAGPAETTPETELPLDTPASDDLTVAPEVIVPEDELVQPEEISTPEELKPVVQPEILVEIETATGETAAVDQTEQITETGQQELVVEEIKELPEFPGTP